jgi:hypothetical protein
MGHVKEPEGVDFIIKSKPLTDKERAEISEFILQYKARNARVKSTRKKKKTSYKKVTA